MNNDDDFKEFDSEESENEFYAYWGEPNWTDNDQLLFEMAYNSFRITGSC
jgi:hypothetical protein